MLFSIAMRTEHLSDYIRLGSVCKSWESAITENPRLPHLGFPLLLMSCETISNSRRDHFLYSPFEHKLHPIRLPDRSRPERCLGSSSDGWLWMVDNRLDLSLLNPFSGALVTLPPLRTNSISEPTLDLLHGRGSLEFRLHENGFAVVRSGEYMRDEYLTKAVWSAKPTDDNCVIVILLQEAYRTVYCRLDETSIKWAEADSLDDGILFLGMNTSMWLPSWNFNECNGNSIYFTGADMFLGDDSGVYNLEDRSYGSMYDEAMKPLYPKPVWVVPYPLKKKKVGFLA